MNWTYSWDISDTYDMFFLEMNFKIFSWNILKNNMKSFKGIENVKNYNTDVEGVTSQLADGPTRRRQLADV